MSLRNTEQSRKQLLQLFRTTQATPAVKFCGIQCSEDVQLINNALPTFCGFVVNVPTSTRSITAAEQAHLAQQLAPNVYAVGVLVDEPLANAVELARSGHFDALQLHGNEDANYLIELRKYTNIPLIQAFRVTNGCNFSTIEHSPADMVLLDSGSGSGKPFDWDLIPDLQRPFLLAGGLASHNIIPAIQRARPWGVDISSGIEQNGRKNADKIGRLLTAIQRSCPSHLEE